MNLNFDEVLTDLIQRKDFDAALAASMQRVATTSIPRMAVAIVGGRIVLYYNPEYLKNTFYSNVVFTLKHEMGHVLWDHIPRYLEWMSQTGDTDRERTQQVFQCAADCAVNCVTRKDAELWKKVQHVPRITPEGMNERYGTQLRMDESFEYYANEIMKIPGLVDGKEGDGDGSHVYWIESNQSTEELQGLAHLVRAQLKQLIKRCREDHERRHGTMPAGLREWLNEYLAEPKIPWWEVLRNYIATHRQSKSRRSVQRPSRPLLGLSEESPDIIATIGRKRDTSYRIFYYEDHSGSMGEPERVALRSEFQALLNAGDDMEIRLMMGDTETHFDQVFTTGDEITWESRGRGGTHFDAYFQYMKQYTEDYETAPDLVIVGTDGECTPIKEENRFSVDVPVLWLLTTYPESWVARAIVDAGYGDVMYADKADRK